MKENKTTETSIPNSSVPETKEDKNALDFLILKETYEKSFENVINVKEEDDNKLKPILQRIADEGSCVLMSFVAPWGGKKVTPYDTVHASIRTYEELGIDKAILDIKTILKEKELEARPDLILVVNSPGGFVTSSYVVAKMIRDNFKHIKVFVPQLAASGGTMLALTGNEVVMGDMSRLSPIDTQLGYKGETVSAQSYRRAIERFDRYYKDKNKFEAPHIWNAMAEKFDPIIREEWDAELMQIWSYMIYILTQAGYEEKNINSIISNLVFPIYPHDFVVDKRAAKEIGIKVKNDAEYQFIWDAMKTWFSMYCLKAESRHHIRYVVHNKRVKPQ